MSYFQEAKSTSTGVKKSTQAAKPAPKETEPTPMGKKNAVVPPKEKKTPALEKYMLEMGQSEQKINLLEVALIKLGTAAGFNMKEDASNKLELLRKVEMSLTTWWSNARWPFTTTLRRWSRRSKMLAKRT